MVVRLSDEERLMFEGVAELMGLSLADTFRQLLRAEARRRGVSVTPAIKTKPRKK